ncbi:hypothetical protein S83_036241 [Arachis hypogaea]
MFIYLFLMNLLSSRNGFQRPDKIKDSHRQSSQLEDLTQKMRECKRLIKEFDREIKDGEGRNSQEVNKQLNDENQSMIKELNSDVALRKTEVNLQLKKMLNWLQVKCSVEVVVELQCHTNG